MLYTLWPINIVVTAFFQSNNVRIECCLDETHGVSIWLRDGDGTTERRKFNSVSLNALVDDDSSL